MTTPMHLTDLRVGRRRFLQTLGAGVGMAGMAACSSTPARHIVPYARTPEELVPGRPLFFATASALGGFGLGLLVESHEGRPTKVEGNPDHPASRGATDVYSQAAVLDLYDADRSQVITHDGAPATWEAFASALRAALDVAASSQGAGVRILTEAVSSPTQLALLGQVLSALPAARWYEYEPLALDNTFNGARLAFGQPLQPVYHFDRADVVVSLDADFLAPCPQTLPGIQAFAGRRRVAAGATPNRLYSVESSLTLTGANADHRLAFPPADIPLVALALAGRMGLDVPPVASPAPGAWLDAVARDLVRAGSRGLVLAGEPQPPAVHALAHAMNARLSSQAVGYIAPQTQHAGQHLTGLQELVQEMTDGRVDLLVVLSGNPVYTAPADLPFADALRRVPFTVHFGSHQDETSEACSWHVPSAHFLETWGDVRAVDGTASIQQPLIEPLYGGRSPLEILTLLAGAPAQSPRDLVRGYWQAQHPDGFDGFWMGVLQKGVIPDSAAAEERAEARPLAAWASELNELTQPSAAGLQVSFRPDPNIYDGRFANNGWLQELPKAVTTFTWDNPALIAPATAAAVGVVTGDVIAVAVGGRSVRVTAGVTPGHPENTLTLHLGYGRPRAGGTGAGIGADVNRLRTTGALWAADAVEVSATGERQEVAMVQAHHQMEGRDLVRSASADEYHRHPTFAQRPDAGASLYPEWPYEGYAWGMAIDLSTCIGCNACVIACEAENNIPVVGREQVLLSREMHWIRVDSYVEQAGDETRVRFQPVPCMHCENAPCEVVCPVNATVHSEEGLNQQVYNRCVGTRYCSDNCPYKVRRFNFLQYTEYEAEATKPLYNPDVTVRSRGVMEKCSYCVQRINAGRTQAEKEQRGIRDGEVVTACQAACPTAAIVFGDINDRQSQVARLKQSPLNYGLLAELNTRPRTTYLASVRNPNPEIGA